MRRRAELAEKGLFAGARNWLLSHEAEYEVMRGNGRKYVEENYRWDVITERISGLICRGSES